MTNDVLGPEVSTSSGSVIRADWRRFGARRLIRVLLLIAGIGYVVSLIAITTQYDTSSPERIAQAQAKFAQLVQEQNTYRDECVKQQPADVNPDDACGPPVTAGDIEQYGGIAQFLDKAPFQLTREFPNFALAFGVAFAVIAFLIGATWIGAEWSTKSLAAWLTWEPRRLSVLGSKVTVLALRIGLLATALQASWLIASLALARWKGISDVPVDFWGGAWAAQGRVVAFALIAALGGFALANLTRNTGAVLGIAFVYFAAVETAVTYLSKPAQEWLLIPNTVGLLMNGGYRITWYDEAEQYVDKSGNITAVPNEILISNWHGAIVLCTAVAVVLAIGAWIFRRADIT